jgi:hypothetical protein
MNISRAFPVFAIAFAVIYVVALEYNFALFTYHPALVEFGPLAQAPKSGPAMYWYGWIATSAIGAAAVAAASLALPAGATDRAWSVLVWLVPAVMIGIVIYILRGYFFR